MPSYDEQNASLKQCSKKHCGEWRSRGDFNKDSSSPDGLGYICRPCRKKHRRQQEVQERTSAYNKKYAEKILN